MTGATSANFEFLRKRSAQLHRLAALAEHYFPTDPNTSLIRGELVPQDPADEPAAQLLARISAEREGAAVPVRKRKARA